MCWAVAAIVCDYFTQVAVRSTTPASSARPPARVALRRPIPHRPSHLPKLSVSTCCSLSQSSLLSTYRTSTLYVSHTTSHNYNPGGGGTAPYVPLPSCLGGSGGPPDGGGGGGGAPEGGAGTGAAAAYVGA